MNHIWQCSCYQLEKVKVSPMQGLSGVCVSGMPSSGQMVSGLHWGSCIGVCLHAAVCWRLRAPPVCDKGVLQANRATLPIIGHQHIPHHTYTVKNATHSWLMVLFQTNIFYKSKWVLISKFSILIPNFCRLWIE